MIRIISPSRDQIKNIQDYECGFYWGLCIESILRKHGIVNSFEYTNNLTGSSNLQLITRNVETQNIKKEVVGAFEGPLSARSLSALGLSAVAHSSQSTILYMADQASFCQLTYSSFYTKKIPQSRTEKTVPIPYQDVLPHWNNMTINFQTFENCQDFEVLAYAGITDEGKEKKKPVILRKGSHLIFGFPIFDLLVAQHTMPYLDSGYYTGKQVANLFDLEKWFISNIETLCQVNDLKLLRSCIWPSIYKSAFTIRHDYDRAISSKRLYDILEFYKEHHIKATWYILMGKKQAPKELTDAMIEYGHEVSLHSIAPDFDEFRREVQQFQDTIGFYPKGYTAHGGIGSRGYLGLAQWQWAETVGCVYGERLGASCGLPHIVTKPETGIPVNSRLILTSCHDSLDKTTKEEDHFMETLKISLPPKLSTGLHVILMNHPDIHWIQLKELILSLDLSNSWSATMEEVANWTNSSKFDLSSDSPLKFDVNIST